MAAAGSSIGKLLCVAFNQDFGVVAAGGDSGFVLLNADPLKERFRRSFTGGLGVVEMLFRSNLLALVGGGQRPAFPPNKVMIWDDFRNQCIAELEFRSDVRAVRLRRDRIAVALDHRVYVYNFADLRPLHALETAFNPRGLLALSPSDSHAVLAAPGTRPGTVRVVHLLSAADSTDGQTPLETTGRDIHAHNNALTQLALSQDGSRLATSSDKGTLIRVFDTETADQLWEFRRGAAKAEIFSLAFNSTTNFLAVSSDKGTIHLYSLSHDNQQQLARNSADGIADVSESSSQERTGNQTMSGSSGLGDSMPASSPSLSGSDDVANPKSKLSFMKGVLPSYFASEWSFAQCHLPKESRCVVGFGSTEKHSLLAASRDGQYYRFTFDPVRGGECKLEESSSYI